MCVWLAYSTWDQAALHTTEAIIFGALLFSSGVLATALLLAGLALGGAWRQLPPQMSWEAMQWLEMLPTLLHSAILTHWSRLIGCSTATPVLSLLYELGFGCTVLGVLDPKHAMWLQILVIAHQVRGSGARRLQPSPPFPSPPLSSPLFDPLLF